MRVERDGAYSNIALDEILKESGLSAREKSFATGLFYGVCEKKLLLDYNIALLARRRTEELEAEVLTVLRMGLYQLFVMERVPEQAAVNESVKLCREMGCGRSAGLVNAVLRQAARDGELRLPKKSKGKNKYYSVKYSCPESIVKLWRESYGEEITLGLLGALDGRPPLHARVNVLRTTPQELADGLLAEGVIAESSGFSENDLLLKHTGAVEGLTAYRNGWFHIQDSASQLCCELLNPQEGQTLLDVCAAPGGKSFTAAELTHNKGQIIACDLYAARLGLISSGAKRLGIGIIRTHEGDSSKLCAADGESLPLADRVLCDVPCSGLGIIRRKPELRYKTDTGIDTLPQLQYEILCSAAAFVKSGGLLLYSTCTLNPAENNRNARRFLDEHDDFEACPITLPYGLERAVDERDSELTLFPHKHRTDGFFISLFRRK